jgi:hypothetical protein
MNDPFAAPDDSPPTRPARSIGQWLLLLAVWSAGLLMWLVYVTAAGYLFFKIF